MRRPEGCDLARERDGARCQGAPMMRAMMERARRPVRAAGSTRPSERGGARFPRTRDDARFPVRSQRAFSRCRSSTREHCRSAPPRRPTNARSGRRAARRPPLPPRVRRARPGVSSARTSTSASAVSSSEKTMSAAPAFKLVYFDLLAKGLPVAMVAAHSGLSWEGKDRDSFDWKTVKANQAPFGQLPLLFLPDGRVVAVHRHRPRHRAPRRSRARLRRRRRLRRRLRHIRHAPRRGRGHLRRPPARATHEVRPCRRGRQDGRHPRRTLGG